MNPATSYPSREAFLAAQAEKARIMSPQKKAPKLSAVRALRRCQIAGQPATVGGIIPIWPEGPPPGWLTMEEARSLIEDGLAAAATAEETAAFLDANDGGEG